MGEQSGYQVSGTGAQMYEKFSTLFMRQFVPDLLEAAALKPGERVLDLACGTGLVARHAAVEVGSTGRVTGLDINAGMLAVARALTPESGATITWVEGSAVDMNLPGASFDVVLCQQGLQFFPDRDAALREMLRVLVREGRIALSVWKSPSPYNDAVAEALDRSTDAQTATKYRAARVVPDAETLRERIVAAGFRNVEVRSHTVTVHIPEIETFVQGNLAGGPVAQAMAALGEEGRLACARRVRQALRRYAQGDGVVYPDAVNLAIALK
jgi:ubiquinone/menaquinone biosynthesis C-methylase UbiE